MSTHRFILEPYKGVSTRHTCPNCHRQRCFSKYIDTEKQIHHCTLIIKLSVPIRRKRQRSITRTTVTNGYKTKQLESLVRTLQLFSLYFHSKHNSVLAMFVGKYLQYEVQCQKHEHSTQIQGIYCPKL